MIGLGSTEFYLAAPPMERNELRAYTTALFDQWDSRVATELTLRDYSLRLEIEEGSIEGLAWVGAAVPALYAAISSYPSFLEGLDKIRAQVREAGDFLAHRAADPFTRLNLKPRIARRSGVLGQLQRLFVRVKRREIDVEQAMLEAERLLGPDAASSPMFMHELERNLRSVRRAPEQLVLPMEIPEEVPPGERLTGGRRPQSQRGAPPVPQQLKIEVWRDSRSGKKQIRITEL